MEKQKTYKIYDLQREEASRFQDIGELYEVMLQGSTCECNQGYDVLDKKDSQMKCENCCRLSNIETSTDEEIIEILTEEFGFKIELV